MAADDHAGAVTEQLRVRAVLGELAPGDQELLRLTEWDGLDVGEVAAVLGCSPAAVKVRLHRARQRLRMLMSEDDSTSDVRDTEADHG